MSVKASDAVLSFCSSSNGSPNLELFEIFQRLGLALAIGLLVGVERGWRERETRAGGRTAGIRTFGLSGFLGGLAGLLHSIAGAVLPAALLVVFGIAFIVFKQQEAASDQDYSVTSVVAALVVFALGVLAVLGDMVAAAAGGVATAGVLAARHSLHGFLRKLTWLELRAALVLLSMTLVALPLLPNRTVDPWGALNPAELWVLTIMIAAISYVGYVAIRVAGASKGILFAGAAGGLVSSTALTLSFARLAANTRKSARPLAAGASVAGAVSLGRTLAIGSALAPVLMASLSSALVPAIFVLLAASYLLVRSKGDEVNASDLHFDNPFDLGMILRFGALLGGVVLASKILVDQLGASTLYGVALASGLMDLDAITLSTARLSGTVISGTIGAAIILTAVVTNLAMKVVLAMAVGGGEYGRLLGLATAAAIAVGAFVHFGFG